MALQTDWRAIAFTRRRLDWIRWAVKRFLPAAVLTLLAAAAHAQTQTYSLQTGIANLQAYGASGYLDCSPTLSPPNPAFVNGQLTFTFTNNCPKETLQTSGTVTVNVPTSFTGTVSGSQVVVSGFPSVSGSMSVTFTPPKTAYTVALGVDACGGTASLAGGGSTATATMLPCSLPARLSIGSTGGTYLSLTIFDTDLTIKADLVYSPATSTGTTYNLQSAPSSFGSNKVSGCTLTLPSSPAFDATGQIMINFTNACATYNTTGTLTFKVPPSITGTVDSFGTGITGIAGSQMITATLTETANSATAGIGGESLAIKWETVQPLSGQCVTPSPTFSNGQLTATATLPACFFPPTLQFDINSVGVISASSGLGIAFIVSQPDMAFSGEAHYSAGTSPTPQISVSPTSLSFGNVTVGENETQQLTVLNTGTTPLTVTAISSSLPTFSVTAPAIPFTVPAKNNSMVTVQFAPPDYQVYNGALTIASTDPSSPTISVPVSGTGVCGSANVQPGGVRAKDTTSQCATLSVGLIQVVQSTQDLNGDVPLIAGKTAIVRVFPISSNGTIPNVTGTLNGQSPDNGATVTAHVAYASPGNLANSLNFTITSPVAGPITYNIQLSAPGVETDTSSATFRFQSPPGFAANVFALGYLRICVLDESANTGLFICPNAKSIASVGPYLTNLFPFTDRTLDYFALPVPPKSFYVDETFPKFDLRLLLTLIKSYRMLNAGLGIPLDHLAAWLPGLTRPYVSAASASSVPTRSYFWSEDVQAEIPNANVVSFEGDTLSVGFGDGAALWYLAHRLGHQFGLTDVPYQTTGAYGLNIFNGRNLVPTDAPELMTSSAGPYPHFHWIAPAEYETLVNPPAAALPASAGVPARDAARSTPLAATASSIYAIVSGTIRLDGSGASLDPVYRIASANPQVASDPSGNYCLVFSNSSSTLGTYCFTVNLNGVTVAGVTQTIFAVTAPWPAGTTKLTLNSGSTALATLAASQDPVVTITSPQPGAKWQGTNTISWTTTGTGSSSAVSSVLYSSDGGNTWMPMDLDNTDSSYTFDTGQINGGSQVYFQVLSSTGLNTGSATVGPINVVQTPQAGANPAAISFGNVAPGQVQDQTFVITNNGSGPLSVTKLSTDNPALAVVFPGALPFQVSGGTAVSAGVRLTAPAAGTFSANFIVTSNDPVTPTLKIPVTANSSTTPAPSISLTPQPIDFGNVPVGQSFAANLTVSNTGTADLTVSAISSSDPEFTTPGLTLPTTISASGSQGIQIQFTPTSTGAKKTTLTVTSNDPSNASSTFVMTGIGVAAVAGAPSIAAGGLVNASDYQPKASRGALAFAFGTFSVPSLQAQSLPLGFSLGGASVTVGGFPAAVYVTNSTFIEFEIPFEAPLGSNPVVVTINGVPSNSLNITIADYGVGIFEYYRTATQIDPIITHLDYTLVTPASPALPNETLLFWVNGIGKLNNPPKTGAAVSSTIPSTAVDTPTVLFGGTAVTASYAGLVATFLGEGIVVATVPAQIADSTIPVVIQFPGDSSPSMNLYVKGNVTGSPKIGVAPSSLTFGNVTVGQNSSLSIAVSNSGTAALTVSSITSSNSVFAATSPTTPFTAQPGGSTVVTIGFSPTAAGSQSGNLTIASNDPASPQFTVGVSGAGTAAAAPKISVTPSSLTFGNVTVGQNSSLTLTVANSGTAPLTVNSITSSNTMFASTSPTTPFTVQPGGSTVVTIRFSPTAAGSQSGNLTIASNDPASPQFTVGVSGAGTAAAAPSITVSPATLAFGSVTVGKPFSMTLTINNTGTATLSVSSISANNPMFTPSATSASVAATASFNVSVQFAPTGAGAQSATLTLASNDPAHPSITVPLTGTGVSTAPSTVTLSVDGGTFNNTVGFPGVANAVFVNRLTPASYPATLTAIQIYFGNRSNGLQMGAPFTLVAATNPSGSPSFSAATLGIANDYPATVSALGAFSTYTLPSPITITSGDFVVGFAAVNPAGLYPADEDQITKSQGRSYVSSDGTTFTVIDSYGAGLAGNFGIRAVVTVN